MLNVLDLFSGIGGFSLGLEATGGFRTIGFCEIKPFCQKILQKHWPHVPIFPDVRKLKPANLTGGGAVNVICGGYPCQPFSQAGKRGGHEDERHLWPEMLRIIRGFGPRWVIAENVAGHISLGFDEVAASLEADGFTVWPFVIPACAVDAPHRRDRLWIVAHADSRGLRQQEVCPEQSRRAEAERAGKTVADASCELLNRSGNTRPGWWPEFANGGGWIAEPSVGRVAHGIPNRVDRLKGLGNAVVPQIPFLIGSAILEFERGGDA